MRALGKSFIAKPEAMVGIEHWPTFYVGLGVVTPVRHYGRIKHKELVSFSAEEIRIPGSLESLFLRGRTQSGATSFGAPFPNCPTRIH